MVLTADSDDDPGAGFTLVDQADPFQCSVYALDAPLAPTAQTLFAADPATPESVDVLGPRLAMTDHAVPFQFMVTAVRPATPTAQTLDAEIAAVLSNSLDAGDAMVVKGAAQLDAVLRTNCC